MEGRRTISIQDGADESHRISNHGVEGMSKNLETFFDIIPLVTFLWLNVFSTDLTDFRRFLLHKAPNLQSDSPFNSEK